MKWPKYVRLQRQKRVLSMRLKVPPTINLFATRCGAARRLLRGARPGMRSEMQGRAAGLLTRAVAGFMGTHRALEKNGAETLFKMLLKYRPEDKKQKRDRLKAEADARAAGKEAEKKKPIVVKYGINHITNLVEQGKAQLVVIAHDVDPLELVLWLPALCRKMGVPYCIVKVCTCGMGSTLHVPPCMMHACMGVSARSCRTDTAARALGFMGPWAGGRCI